MKPESRTGREVERILVEAKEDGLDLDEREIAEIRKLRWPELLESQIDVKCAKCGWAMQVSIHDLEPIDYLRFVCAVCDPPISISKEFEAPKA